MKEIFSILLLILISHASHDNSLADGEDYPRIRASVHPSEVTIGIPIQYRIVIEGKGIKGLKIRLPERREYYPEREYAGEKGEKGDKGRAADTPPSLIPLYIIHNAKRDDNSDGEITSIAITLEMAYYRTGRYFLPELNILDSEEVRIGYKIPEVMVKAVNERSEFQDIEPPLELSGNYTRLIVLGALLLITAVAVILAIRYLQRRGRERAEKVVMTPPIDIFMNEINSLVDRKLIEAERYEEFVIGISFVFRKFLSAQYGFDAMEMTVSEIMRSLEERLTGPGLQGHRSEAARILDLWDLTKFAEFIPSREALTSNLESTVKLARRLSSGGRFGDQSVMGSNK
jgi:hypothetical protein